jgi:hypothetical protein
MWDGVSAAGPAMAPSRNFALPEPGPVIDSNDLHATAPHRPRPSGTSTAPDPANGHRHEKREAQPPSTSTSAAAGRGVPVLLRRDPHPPCSASPSRCVIRSSWAAPLRGSTRSGQRRCLADLSRLQLAWPPPGVVNATSGRRDRSCARARTADRRAAAGRSNDIKPVGTGRPRDLGPGSATPPRACAAGFRRRSLRPGKAWPGDGGGAGPQPGRIGGGHGTRGRDLPRGDR